MLRDWGLEFRFSYTAHYATWGCAILGCLMLCHAPCCILLCQALLWYAIFCCNVWLYKVLWYDTFSYAIVCSAMLRCVVVCFDMISSVWLCYAVLRLASLRHVWALFTNPLTHVFCHLMVDVFRLSQCFVCFYACFSVGVGLLVPLLLTTLATTFSSRFCRAKADSLPLVP